MRVLGDISRLKAKRQPDKVALIMGEIGMTSVLRPKDYEQRAFCTGREPHWKNRERSV